MDERRLADIGHLHHRVDGPHHAPAVLLMNSLGTTLSTWDEVVALLTPACRVIRWDYPGHGPSRPATGRYGIEEIVGHSLCVLDHLGIDRAHVCGLAVGGMAAIAMAAEVPGRVASLTV
jgi:pimeloyl-ACP methyl ester carboxylesterase